MVSFPLKPGQAIEVRVPATTANLGPGFDCLGAALSRYNVFRFEVAGPGQSQSRLKAIGAGAAFIEEQDLTENLLYRSLVQVYQLHQQTPPVLDIQVEMNVPLSRGLGSSATAIVGGIVAGNALGGFNLSEQKQLKLCIDLEGHPDNVVPAFLGRCQLTAANAAATDFPWTICEIPWSDRICPLVAIPDFELSTSAARRVLPQQYDRSDAIFNMAHLGLLLRGLETANPDWLRTALSDRLHQPYRKALIPGFDALQDAAQAAGAYGVVISGAGPTLLALTDAEHQTAVQTALKTTWHEIGVTAIVERLDLDRQGTHLKTL